MVRTQAVLLLSVVQSKSRFSHFIKSRTFTVQRCYYFFVIRTNKKNSSKFEKLNNNEFFNDKNYLCICDIDKLKHHTTVIVLTAPRQYSYNN